MHYLHVLLPSLTVAASFVHVVLNLGRRIAAAISSGSINMSSKRFFRPASKASANGLQCFSDNLAFSSLEVNMVMVGSSHPICTFVSACKMLMAWATGLMMAAYSDRNVISTGLNLWKNKQKITLFYISV